MHNFCLKKVLPDFGVVIQPLVLIYLPAELSVSGSSDHPFPVPGSLKDLSNPHLRIIGAQDDFVFHGLPLEF